jgi:hypothetical protein
LVGALAVVGGQAALAARFSRQIAVLRNERFSAGTLLPPLLAISRLFSTLIDAKPRLDVLIFGLLDHFEARG